jgi:hypothetical protein
MKWRSAPARATCLGVCASRGAGVQFAVAGNGNLAGHGAAGGVFSGGLSGVAFGAGVELVSRVTQGCQPVGPTQRITAADGNVVLELDGKPPWASCCKRWMFPCRTIHRKRCAASVHPGWFDQRRQRGGFWAHRAFWERHAGAAHPRAGWSAPGCGLGRYGGAGHATGLLPAQCRGCAGRPGAHLHRDPRGVDP